MSELQPPEAPADGIGGGGPSENAIAQQGIGYSKRQRRPSVRLGDIGDQPATLSYDSYIRRTKQWSSDSPRHPLGKSSNSNETLEIDLVSIRRAKRGGGGGGGGSKRVRSKPADADAAADADDADEQGFRQSPFKQHSPVHDDKEVEEEEEEEEEGDDVEKFCGLEDGVRMWLNGLGLGKYAPVFEIHEVDEDVLPQLTLEDLKDMGINAVGSRRKLYSAIQKLAKGFS